ncbi:MAG: hypothetical protein ACLF0G_17760 [Candidatus Brocadiia bacterium]
MAPAARNMPPRTPAAIDSAARGRYTPPSRRFPACVDQGVPMELSFKPDLDAALERWAAFWEHEIIGRPCCAVTAPRDGVEPAPAPPNQVPPWTDFDAHLARAEAAMASRYYGGEAMPFFQPSFGPDQIGAFVGARLDWSEDSAHTSWSVPFVERWEQALPLRLGRGNDAWERMLELCRKAARRGEGKFLVGMLDLHSNLDWLAAVRGPDRLCMDLLDAPEQVHRAMANVRQLYPQVYTALYEAGGMAGRGTCGWLPYYCQGRYATTQCDYACLLSPPQFNDFVLPALEEESDFLDRSVYHYDGATALQHFEAVTGIASLDGIQWTPTAGGPPITGWVELLQRFQAAGKSVFVSCTAEELQEVFHPALDPALVFYRVGAESQAEAEALLAWLEAHT